MTTEWAVQRYLISTLLPGLMKPNYEAQHDHQDPS